MQGTLPTQLLSVQDFFQEHKISEDDISNAKVIVNSNVLKRLLACLFKENLIQDVGNFLAIADYSKQDTELSIAKYGSKDFDELINPYNLEKCIVAILLKPQVKVIKDPLELLDFIQGDVKENLSNLNEYGNLSRNDIKNIVDSFEERWLQFREEINCTIANDLPHVAYRAKLNEKIIESGRKFSCDSLYKLITAKESSTFINDIVSSNLLTFLEQWSAFGHPYHPCYKSKLGMSDDEIINYSPEFNEKVNLVLAALHKNLSLIQSSKEEVDCSKYVLWFKKYFEDIYLKWEEQLRKKGLEPKNYIPILVHPWQADHVINHKLPGLLKTQDLVVLKDTILPSYAAVSLRTMIPVNSSKEPNKFKPHIKLPVTAQMTSVIRYISPSKIYNSTILSKLLRDILRKENHFDNTLYFLDEEVTVSLDNLNPETCYETEEGKALTKGQYVHYDQNLQAEERKRHLSVTYRENPYNYQTDGQLIVPLTALFINSPISKKSFFLEILDNHEFQKDKLSLIVDYFRDYAKLMTHGVLQMYLKYGISLECHQQNLCLLFEENKPVKILLRDTGGLEIISKRLEKAYCMPDLHSDTNICFQDTFPRKQLIHGLFYSHLIEIIKVISRHYDISSNELYSELAKIVEDELNQSKAFMEECDWKQEKEAFMEEDWDVKTLLLMRIVNAKEIFAKCKNLLS